MTQVLLREEYGDYDLVVTLRWGVLVGYISGEPQVPVPDRAILRMHGTARDLERYPEYKEEAGIPEENWAYRFWCSCRGDINMVNGGLTGDFSTATDARVWTPGSVLDHMKDCLAA